jgi:hypothetical protein
MNRHLSIPATLLLLSAGDRALAEEPEAEEAHAEEPDGEAPHPEEAYAEEPHPEQASPEATDSASSLARRRDASIDRGFTTGHAETIGEGQWSFNSYQLFLAGLTYGFSPDAQLSVTTLLPITSDIPLVLGLSPKFVVDRGANHVVAVRANLLMGFETTSGVGGGIVSTGPYVDYYLDRRGRVAVHGGLTVGGVFGGEFGTDLGFARGLVLTFDAGFSAAVSDSVKIILEGQAFGLLSGAGFNVLDTTLFNYGVRFYGEDLAVDLAFVRPLAVDIEPLLLGVPYVTFSARF